MTIESERKSVLKKVLRLVAGLGQMDAISILLEAASERNALNAEITKPETYKRKAVQKAKAGTKTAGKRN